MLARYLVLPVLSPLYLITIHLLLDSNLSNIPNTAILCPAFNSLQWSLPSIL